MTDKIARIPATPLSEEQLAPPFSEEALALEFATRHGDNVRYVAKWNRWLLWNGQCWCFDGRRQVFSLARGICREAAATINKDNEAKRIASAKTRAAVVSLVSDDPHIAATIEQWDADPWLLNTPEGVIDLRSGERRAARPDDYMTKTTTVGPGGDCPLWLAFLQRVLNQDEELQKYLQRFCGYALTGITREHAMAFLYGVGRNGKSVLLNTISGIMNDYHAVAPMEALTASNTERHPTELAGLMGARLVTAIETEQGHQWSETRLKALTGGDQVTARFMRQDFFTFSPQFKLMIAGNQKPGLKTVDEAIRGRMNLIPFSVVIPKDERDHNLLDKLKAEWPGILAWMIEGCREWQSCGRLLPPVAVMKATEEYLTDEDTLQNWLNECCRSGPDEWCSSGNLFASWKQWAEAANAKVGNRKEFSNLLQARGFSPLFRDGRGYLGLTIYQAPKPPEPRHIWEPSY